MFSIYEDLPLSVRPTYFYALRAAVVGAVAAGVASLLSNIATKILQASQWDLAILNSLQGAGMLLAFFWGGFAARRRKMPFFFWPQVVSALLFFVLAGVCLSWSRLASWRLYLSFGGASLATVFCVLVGAQALVTNVGAPASAGILSANYPARLRGMITGFTQSWVILIVLIVSVAGAEIIQRWGWTYQGILPVGGLFALAAAFIYLRVKVRGELRLEEAEPEPFRPFKPFQILVKDKLFRTYMIDFFFFGLANLMTMPIVYIVLRDDLGASFRQIQWTIAIIPAATGLVTVGFWGRMLDRSNPVIMRACMNLAWVALPLCYYFAPRHAVALGPLKLEPVYFIWFGSFVQGCVAAGQGLIWTLGAMYFAKKEDVPLYQGVHIGLTGVRALVGPFLGPACVVLFGGGPEGRRALFLLSSLLMVLSALLMFKLAARIRRESGGRMPSMAEKEAAEYAAR